MVRLLSLIACLVGTGWFFIGPGMVKATDDPVGLYVNRIKPLLKAKCLVCHGATRQEGGLRLDTATSIRRGGDSGPIVDWETPDASLLLHRVGAEDPGDRMPPEGRALTSAQIDVLRQWIGSGGAAPDQELPQADPGQHWAFQPRRAVTPPDTRVHPVDAFVDRKLQQVGLSCSPPASSRTLIRRLFLDLHGLPPSPGEITEFESAFALDPEVATANLVDRLLASPRYGERWAQHWLDLVRYADTDGFEVNTPRPNAWPYRDYVISAWNQDKPYDQFVMEQLAGDALGQDAATGFLVAAPALLPGQIGKDEASIRLARQDALDEIVIGTSATFLGLTVGCARCHDHKFDPISQQDYYAMQACFAGVDYGERPVTEGSKQRADEMAMLVPELERLHQQLIPWEPLAKTRVTLMVDDEAKSRVAMLVPSGGHQENSKGEQRGFESDPGDDGRSPNLSQGGSTWWPNQANQDVFSWDLDTAGTFHLWVSWGILGHQEMSRDARYILDQDGDLETRDDQTEVACVDQSRFANGDACPGTEQSLWSGFRDAGVHRWTPATRLVLRGGDAGDRLTADVLLFQEVAEDATESADSGSQPRLRVPVHAAINIERFPAVEARYVRFTTLATNEQNRYQPCLDELEIFAAGSPAINVALASAGGKPTSSGNLSDSGKHQLPHINDGRYGNSFSWISNEIGRGWVQIELAEVQTIDRVEWARDRLGKFSDRLPVDYQIEVSLDGVNWIKVATSTDRMPAGTPVDAQQQLVQRASGDTRLSEMVARWRQLKLRKAELEQPRMVFAGTFHPPTVTHLLTRGDPEQPADVVAPAAPHILRQPELQLTDTESTDQQRRMALAKWIVDPDNPLAARVIANRVWQFHFGRGLVATPSDFGLNGAAPTHPELLDWLANELVVHDWSIKHLHRVILSSRAYQQSSAIRSEARSIDADGRWLWRYPSRRLEAEAIRDSMLLVNGELNLKAGGPGFDFFETRGGLSGFPPREQFEAEGLRRMVYAHRIRMETVPVFGAFDCPDAGQPTPQRSQSTTAIQALNLFNSPFVVAQADRFSQQVRRDAGDSIEDQVNLVFLRSVGRVPDSEELAMVLPVARKFGLATVCRAVFNSSEFLFIP